MTPGFDRWLVDVLDPWLAVYRNAPLLRGWNPIMRAIGVLWYEWQADPLRGEDGA